MTELERAILHIKTRADAWAVREVEQALSQEPSRKDCRVQPKPIENEIENEILILQAYKRGYDDALSTKDHEKPQEPCDDAISREYLKKIAQSEGAYGYVSAYDIATAPSVTPSRRKGHWIKVTNGRGGHECDLCHEYAPSYQDGDEYLTKYCPNCGADMRGDTE